MIHERHTAIAYILWLPPLGILGAHKFYLRQPLMGVLYFFTGGLVLIGWLIDLFTLSDQVAEFNEKLYAESGYLHEEIREEMEEDMDLMEDRIEELEEEVSYLKQKLKASSSD